MKKFILISLVSLISISAFPSEKGGNRVKRSLELRLALRDFSDTNSCPLDYASVNVCAELEVEIGSHGAKEIEKRFFRECCLEGKE